MVHPPASPREGVAVLVTLGVGLFVEGAVGVWGKPWGVAVGVAVPAANTRIVPPSQCELIGPVS